MAADPDLEYSAGSFSFAYSFWLNGGKGRQTRVESELMRTYRSAWSSGEGAIVLNFVMLLPHAEGFDLVAEGLRSDDPPIASQAACVALTLISRGIDLGESLRSDLEGFANRFPDWSDVSRAALDLLDEKDSTN